MLIPHNFHWSRLALQGPYRPLAWMPMGCASVSSPIPGHSQARPAAGVGIFGDGAWHIDVTAESTSQPFRPGSSGAGSRGWYLLAREEFSYAEPPSSGVSPQARIGGHALEGGFPGVS